MIRDARSWGLLFMAGVCGSRAAAYLPGRRAEPLPIGLREVAQVLPVWVYAVIWGAATIGLATVAFRQWPPKWWQCTLVFPAMFWGGMYFTSWLSERAENGVTNAFLFWALAGVIACLLLIPPRRLR